MPNWLISAFLYVSHQSLRIEVYALLKSHQVQQATLHYEGDHNLGLSGHRFICFHDHFVAEMWVHSFWLATSQHPYCSWEWGPAVAWHHQKTERAGICIYCIGGKAYDQSLDHYFKHLWSFHSRFACTNPMQGQFCQRANLLSMNELPCLGERP